MGEWEIFLDDCVEFGKRLQGEVEKKTKVDAVLGKTEVHVQCVMDQTLGLEDEDTAKAVLK
jgi:hypothetical protein